MTTAKAQSILSMPWTSFCKALTAANLSHDEQLALIRERAHYDFEFFTRFFFPEHCRLPFSPMHHDFCQAEVDPMQRGRREVIAAPRGHAKTTFKALFKVIHAICYQYEPFIEEKAKTKTAGSWQERVPDQGNRPQSRLVCGLCPRLAFSRQANTDADCGG